MIPLKTMLRFGIGQTGAQIFRDTPAVLLPVFMATMLGIPPWLGGLAILLPKFWVILCDPLVGMLSDRTRATVGRTPFLMTGAIVTSLGFLALFAITDFPTPLIAAATVSIVYVIAVTGFSTFSVPYLAIASELSEHPHERTKLIAFRILFASLGVVLGVGFAQPTIRHFGGGAHGWHMMAVLASAICLVSMGGTALGLRRVPLSDAAGSVERPLAALRTAFRNRPFVVLTAVHFIQSISQACSYSAVGLIFLYIVGDVGLMIPFTLAMCISGVLSQPMWLAISRRAGKLPSFVGASLLYAAVTASWLWIDTPGVIQVPLVGACRVEVVLILVRAAICGVMNQGFLLLITSMFTDTVEFGRRHAGRDVAGSLAGGWSAIEKLAFAVGPLIGGLVLTASGFVPSKGGLVAQSAGALHGVVWLYSLIPAAIFLASLPLLFYYRLSLATARFSPLGG